MKYRKKRCLEVCVRIHCAGKKNVIIVLINTFRLLKIGQEMHVPSADAWSGQTVLCDNTTLPGRWRFEV